MYSVLLNSMDQWTTLIPLTRSGAIKPGEINHLTVIATGDIFKLFINGEFVNEFQDINLPSGEVGLMLSPDCACNDYVTPQPQGISLVAESVTSKVEFDNLEIHAPEDMAPEKGSYGQLPQIQPEAGRLVFSSDRDGNRNIYTVDSSGGNLKQLTDDPAADYAPRWSPDGKKIVFVSRRDGDAEIFVMDADGSNLIQLTDNAVEDISPDWSPDGRQIIFSSKRGTNYDLYLMSARGEREEIKQITDTKDDEINPSISPNGETILFQAKRRITYGLYTMPIDDNKPKNAASNYDGHTYTDPAWSFDGQKIIHVEKSGGGGDIKVKDLKAAASDWEYVTYQGSDLYPGWSPSGNQIVFVSTRDGQSDIYIIRLNGDGIFRVTHTESVEESPDWTNP